uniref:NADH dehydrogenase subunit 2 n=1 Tax=Ishige okamurae TaxID=233772 RepID=UPI002E784186|nr:NADH dehydrogenase subunit 2 [Ishige okamurae]WBP70207.1 NADH dehydrogenase subunit 2 [Ishige okamurae]
MKLVFQSDLSLFLPEFFVCIGLLLILLYGSFSLHLGTTFYTNLNFTVARLSILILIQSFFLILNNQTIPFYTIVWDSNFVLDSAAKWSKLIISSGLISCVCCSFSFLFISRIRLFEIFVFFLNTCLSFFLLISSYSLTTLYLSIELISMTFYILACLKRDSGLSSEAGLKYFILGSLASVFFLFGSLYIYISIGSIGYQPAILLVSTGLIPSIYIYLGFLLISCALLFKIGAAPYHNWVVDVYDGAPTLMSFLFSVVPKFGFFVALSRIVFTLGPSMFSCLWESLFLCCGLFGLLIGCLGGLGELKLKRVFAYSSIGHVGFICLSYSTGILNSLYSSFIYLFVYTITSIFIWTYILQLDPATRKKLSLSNSLGLLQSNQIFSFTIIFTLLSLAGIPPFAGFFAKLNVFSCLMESSFYFIGLLTVLLSIVSSFYYLRFVKIIFFEKSFFWVHFVQIDKNKAGLLSLSFLCINLYIFTADLMFLLSSKTSLGFLA